MKIFFQGTFYTEFYRNRSMLLTKSVTETSRLEDFELNEDKSGPFLVQLISCALSATVTVRGLRDLELTS